MSWMYGCHGTPGCDMWWMSGIFVCLYFCILWGYPMFWLIDKNQQTELRYQIVSMSQLDDKERERERERKQWEASVTQGPSDWAKREGVDHHWKPSIILMERLKRQQQNQNRKKQKAKIRLRKNRPNGFIEANLDNQTTSKLTNRVTFLWVSYQLS